jgi:molybdopterin-dependent oxidoreductase alpha subunit
MSRINPKTAAAGIASVAKVTQITLTEMGLEKTFRTLTSINQKTGFDCPGCAWPDREENRPMFEFCENGAKALADEATKKRVDAQFFADWSVEALRQQSDRWLNAQGRIALPIVLRSGASHYEPITWDDAFGLVGAELKALDSPDQAAFYTSGRTSNEAAFLYQLFARKYGTNNLPDCSNMCHESSGEGMRESLGVGKATVSLEDFEKADAIFIFGQNPGTNHPRMLGTLQAAARRGCKIVSVNPLPEPGLVEFRNPQEVSGLLGMGTKLASLFLPIRINGDVALLQGMAKLMLEAEDQAPGTVLDRTFIRDYTQGFEEYVAHTRTQPWDEIVESCGLSKEQIKAAADIAGASKRTICCWAMGLTQHRNAVANIQEIVNFLLLQGNMGRPGAGACPVRGHSNVQGDRTMGIWERMPDAFLDRLGSQFRFAPPREPGLDTVETIHAMSAGKVKVFVAMGGNFLSASPDTELTGQGLQKCRLTVHVSTKLNRSHLAHGEQALILPSLGRTDRDLQASGLQYVTTENSMSVVSRSEGVLDPPSPELRSEVAIVAGLAKATLGEDWSPLVADYGSIRRAIEGVIPGFEAYNERIEREASFVLPSSARERVFLTATQKANFSVHPVALHRLAHDELMMMTIRSHDQFNTTVYTDDDRYRGVYGGRRVVLMNAADIKKWGLNDGDAVDISSTFNGVTRTAPKFTVAAYPIPQGCAATYFPETNCLVPIDSVAAKSNTPTSKSVVIKLHPVIV